MIKFSVKEQTFYDTSLSYSYSLPNDLIDIPEEKHSELIQKINEGRLIDSNLEASEAKPDQYHTWKNGDWVDERTEDQKQADEIKLLYKLSQKQFRLMLLNNSITNQQIQSAIDTSTKKDEYTIIFQYADTFEFNSDFISSIMPILGINTQKLIVMWKQSQSL